MMAIISSEFVITESAFPEGKHQQLAGIDPVEVVVPSTNDELKKLWKEGKHWQRN